MANYKVVLKGEREPIYLESDVARKLMSDLQNGLLNGMVNLAGNLVDVGAIKAVISADDGPSFGRLGGAEMIAGQEREWKEWKLRRLALSPHERAQTTGFMNYMCQAIRGRPLTEKETEEVKVAQERWFVEHSDFHSANPACYFAKHEIDSLGARQTQDPSKPRAIKELLVPNALNFAERHLNS